MLKFIFKLLGIKTAKQKEIERLAFERKLRVQRGNYNNSMFGI
jgi:hypothetical protein